MRECLPDPASLGLDGIISGPVLDRIARGMGLDPCYANAVHLLKLCQINDNPLRMQGITFASETLREIRIALPIGAEVPVGKPGKTGVISSVVAGETTMRQRVSVGI